MHNPSGKKRPRKLNIKGSDSISWRFSEVDLGGEWGWNKLSDGSRKDIVSKLGVFEKMNWDEIIRQGSHPIQVEKVIKDAKDRLREINRDDIDELMSFRISGKRRLWCINRSNIMHVLWWDPGHKVCPSAKHGT